MSALDLKDKKYSTKIEQQCLNILLVFTSYNEGQICLLKVITNYYHNYLISENIQYNIINKKLKLINFIFLFLG